MRSKRLTCQPERHDFMMRSPATLSRTLVSLDYAAMCIALPHIAQQLSLTSRQTPAVLAVYGFFFAALSLIGGVLCARTGSRRVFIVGRGIFLLASVMGALACNGVWMLAARALQGTGMALLHQALKGGESGGESGSKAPVSADSGAVTGVVAGLVLGAVFSEIDWRLIFLLNLPALWVICRSAGHDYPWQKVPGRTFPAGALIASVAAGSLFLALTGFARTGQPDFIINRITALLCLLFLVHEKWSPRPLFPRPLRDNATFCVGWLSRLCYVGSAGSQWYLLAFYGQQQSISSGDSAGLLCVAVLLIIAGRQVYTLLSGRIRHSALLTGGFLCCAAGLFLAGETCDHPLSVTFIAGVCLSSLGQGLLCPALFRPGSRGIPDNVQEQAARVMLICRFTGGVIALAMLNVITGGGDLPAAWPQAFYLIGWVALAGGVAALNTPPTVTSA